jgi:transaldolase
MSDLQKLIEYGQSYWIDNLNRKMITSGELKRRVTEEGLRGITSNPAIFNKAISKTSDYDEQIKDLALQGYTTDKIYEELVVKDVQDACDILRPVYEQSEGIDGFVSLEVSPYLARHTQETMVEARHLFEMVSRPNCFIKIPGTEEGLPAIEQMLYEGININITLLFSIQRYDEVALTYIKALKRRAEERKDLSRIASVASFFVSRMDVLVDQILAHRILPGKTDDTTLMARELTGKTAIANAKLAYQNFKKIFNSENWKELEKLGARVQRPLWASTSTKNPNYSDVMYVEPLIGKHTVNTLPDDTIAAFADHGKAKPDTVEADIKHAQFVLSRLVNMGIDLDCVTGQLENEGIQKFIEPFDALMASLKEKRKALNAS